MSVILNLAFPHDYSLEFDVDFRENLMRYFYPGAQDFGKDGISLTISVGNGKWMGIFSPGYKNAHSGVYSMPNPNYILVVSSGLGTIVNASDPKDYEEISIFPIIDIIVHEPQKKIVAIDFTNISVYSENGLMCDERHVSWDGIEIEKMDENGIVGKTWNAPLNMNQEFYYILKTGEYIGEPS